MTRIAITERGSRLAQLLPGLLPDCSITAADGADIFIFDSGMLPEGTIVQDAVVLLNADQLPNGLICTNCVVITYGLDPHATVTYSSVAEDKNGLRFCYCLQRGLHTLAGDEIEGMDIPVAILGGDVGIYHGMCAVTCALLCGVPVDASAGIWIQLPAEGLDIPAQKE